MVPGLGSFHCPSCDCTFSRREHLQRHQVKHGWSRSFQCNQCLQVFNRSDILRRHEKTHLPTPTTEPSPTSPDTTESRKRARVSAACDACATAKLRCNGVIPCDRCVKKSLPCRLERPHGVLRRRAQSRQLLTPTVSFQLDGLEGNEGDEGASPSSGCQEVSGHQPELSPATEPGSYRPVQLPGTTEGHSRVEAESPSRPRAQESARPNAVPDFPSVSVTSMLGEGLEMDCTPLSMWLEFPPPLSNESPGGSTGFPHFLWQSTDELSVAQGLLDDPFPAEATGPHHTPQEPRTDRGGHPYANDPFAYCFRKGLSLKFHHISHFLQNPRCWDEISTLSELRGFRLPGPAQDLSSMRDLISARLREILHSTVDTRHPIGLPHSFPPPHVVGYLLRAGQSHLAGAYPILHPTVLREALQDAGEDMAADPGLFLTSLLAFGCLVTPMPAARSFGVQLMYLVRISINERAARDEIYLTDKWVIMAWQLLTIFSAWSGSRRHSEIAAAFHGIFTAFFTRRGYYKSQFKDKYSLADNKIPDWEGWIQRERDRRFGQVWYIIEQEVSFFYGVPSTVDFAKLRCPLPSATSLFLAESQQQWRALVRQKQGQGPEAAMELEPASLCTLYHAFCRVDFLHLSPRPTPLQLRMLLCALQTQVSQYAQSTRFIPQEGNLLPTETGLPHPRSSALLQQEELAGLLSRWWLLRDRVFQASPDHEDATTCALMYHLIGMELYICFDDVQLVMGKDGFDAGRVLLPALRHWSQSPAALKALAHAGQVIKAVQSLGPLAVQPLWWPVALSRAALVLRCYTCGMQLATGNALGFDESLMLNQALISLNDPHDNLGMHGKVMQAGEGIPCIRDQQGKLIPINRGPDLFDALLVLLKGQPVTANPLCESVTRFLEDVKQCVLPYSRDMPNIT